MPGESADPPREASWFVKFSGASEIYKVWGSVRQKLDEAMIPAILTLTPKDLYALYSALLTWFSEVAFLIPPQRIDWHVDQFATTAELITKGDRNSMDEAARRLVIQRIYIDKDVQSVRALLPTAKEPPELTPDRFAKLVLSLAGDTAEVKWDG